MILALHASQANGRLEGACAVRTPMPVAVVTKLTSQNRTYEPPSLQGAKTMAVSTRERKKKMVSSSTILATR